MGKVNVQFGLIIDLDSSELTLDTITYKGSKSEIQIVKQLYGDLIERVVETIMDSDI